MAEILQRLQKLPELSEEEKLQWARCLAATPDERWQMNVRHRNLLVSLRNSMSKASVTK